MRPEVYDPAVHDTAAWRMVTCTRCKASYQCTPWADYMDPAPDLGWTEGSVCEPCLHALARQKDSTTQH